MTLSGKKLILVEDDPTIQLMIKQIFMMLNCENYDISKSVTDAISKCDKIDYDFVILDINLDNESTYNTNNSGIELIKYLHSKNKPMPVLVFSANIEDFRIELFRYNSNYLTIRYLEKPSSLIEISEAIKDCLEIHSCKDLRENKFPLMETSMQELKNEVFEMKQKTIKNVATNIFLDFLTENKVKIVAGLTTLCGSLLAYYLAFLQAN